MVFGGLIYLLIFHLTRKYRFSVILRKYCFAGILFLLIFEGNLEEFVFYLMAEWRLFFYTTFTHKIANSILLGFGFIAVIYAFGCQLLFLAHYRKRAKFLADGFCSDIWGAFGACIEGGAGPFLSGCIHALLLDYLFIQTFILIII